MFEGSAGRYGKHRPVSKWHKAEYKMARNIDFNRNNDFKIIHICLEDLRHVTDWSFQLILESGDFMQWNNDATVGQKQKFFEQLVAKIYKRLAD